MSQQHADVSSNRSSRSTDQNIHSSEVGSIHVGQDQGGLPDSKISTHGAVVVVETSGVLADVTHTSSLPQISISVLPISTDRNNGNTAVGHARTGLWCHLINVRKASERLVKRFFWNRSGKEQCSHLQTSQSESSSGSRVSPEKEAGFTLEIQPLPESEKEQDIHDPDAQSEKPRLWSGFVEEYRKNYCPRRSPPLILPSAPTEDEKYSYVKMKRHFLVFCDVFSLVSLGYSAWSFAITSPAYCWFALFVTINEIYIFTALFVATIGKELDIDSHKQLLENYGPNGDDTAPTIDIYLPVCREPLAILENTWRYINALQYPKSRISVFVLDDGIDNDDPESSVRALASRFKFNYIRRPDRPHLKKSGNLRHAFAHTSGDYITIFDADFCPRPDFLLETIPYLTTDEKIAILQTPQFFRSSSDQAWIEQGAGASQEIVYRVMETSRDEWGAAICVGSNAVYRRAAFESIGGTVAIDCSEDIYTGWHAITHGWKVKYLPLVLACGICPDTPAAYFNQQMRWCHGTMSLVSQRDFWTNRAVNLKIKICFIISAINYITNAVEPFIYPPLAPLILLTQPDQFKYYNLFFVYPTIVVGFLVRKFWTRGRYTLSVMYTERVLAFASLQSIWDLMVGRSLGWKPSGGGGGPNHRYRKMRILAWGWTIAHTGLFVGLAMYRVMKGLRWYNLMPIVVLNAISLLLLHRFLLYRHPKV